MLRITKRKFFGTILGITLFILSMLSVTYASYYWKGENSIVTFNFSDPYFYCETGLDVNVDGISPVLDYRSGSYQTFKVNNVGRDDTRFSLSLNITSISDSLLSESFKYKLLVDETGGSNNCADTNNSNCVEVENGSGNFSSMKVGMNTLVENILIPNNSKYQYYLFMYIDGNMENDPSMQNSNIVSSLDVCEIVVFLDYNGGTGEKEFLKVTSTYAGLPTATRDTTTVTYHPNGGNTISNDNITYTFQGWYLENDFQTRVTSSSEVTSTMNHTLYAKWSSSKTITLPTPTQTGYTFLGWYSDSGLTKYVGTSGESYNPQNNIDLYAKWEKNNYSITYNLNYGAAGSSAPPNANYNEVVHISNPTKTFTVTGNINGTGATIGNTISKNATFAGWSSTNINTSTAYYGTSSSSVTTAWNNTSTKTTAEYFKNLTPTKDSNVTLNANWTITAFNLPTVSKTGYTCNWNTASDGSGTSYASGASYTPNASGSVSITMYARCTINQYNVTYNYSQNGGTSATTTTAKVNYGANIDLTPTATKNGWTFIGWNTNKDATTSLSSLTMGANDVTLYAIYRKEAITLTAKWNANGATLSFTDDKTCTLDAVYNNATQATSCTVTAPTITRSGYTILGFNTSASATTSTLNSGGTLTLTSSNSDSTWYAITKKEAVTLTAKWNANGATLSFTTNKNCTLDAVYNTTAQATSCTVTAPTITRSGYTVLGFNTNANATTSTLNSGGTLTLTASNSNSTWYAITTKEITVTFVRNGATSITPSGGTATTENSITQSCTLANTATECSITSPEIEASTNTPTVVGWNTSSDATTSSWNVATTKTFNANATYYAITKNSSKTLTVTYEKGTGISSIGATSATCTIEVTYNGNAQPNYCNVSVPTITISTGYNSPGWYNSSGTKILDGSATIYATPSTQTLTAKATANTYTVKFYNNLYYMDTANELIVTLNGRSFFKKNSGAALVGYVYGEVTSGTYTGSWTGPLLVSTNQNAVAFYSTYDSSTLSSEGSFDYNGVTYYYSASEQFMSGDLTDQSGLPNRKKYTASSGETSVDIVSAARQLLDDQTSTVSQTFTYGLSQSLTTNSYTKTGHTLTGWSTGPTNGTFYSNGQSVSNLTTQNNGIINLYANWRKNRVNVQFHMNGGSWAGSTDSNLSYEGSYVTKSGSKIVSTYTYGQTGIDLANYNNAGYINISRTGYSASSGAEWKLSDGTTFNQSGNVVNANDLCDASSTDCTATLYVNWVANTYTATLNSGNLLLGLNNVSSHTNESGRMSYAVSNKTVTVTASTDDGYGFVNAQVYLTANQSYTFSCTTNGTWGSTSGTDTVEAFLMLNAENNTYYHMGSTNYTFTPTTSGIYYLRLDVNQSGKSHTFSNIKIYTTSSKTVTYSSSYGTLDSLSQPGLTFQGWYTAESGGSQVTSSTTVTTANNHTLYAQWTTNSYTVSFASNDTNYGSVSSSSISVVYGTKYWVSSNVMKFSDSQTITATATSATGYTTSFSSWSSTSGAITENASITANFSRTANTYTLIADSSLGTVPSTTGWTAVTNHTTATKSVTYNSTYGTLPTLTRTGYTFRGWFNGPASQTITISASSTNNYNYYRVLKNLYPGVVYNITMDKAELTSGTATSFATIIYDFTSNEGLAITTQSFGSSVSYSITCPSNADPTHDIELIIYAGVNGSTSNNAVKYTNLKIGTNGTTAETQHTSSSTYSLARNQTVYDKWTANTYTISFNGNGSTSGSTASKSCTYDVNCTLTSNGFAKTGYTFAGWATTSSGSVAYANGATVKNLTATNGDTVPLYAKWTANTYTVTLNNQSATTAGTATVYYQYNTTKTVNGTTAYYYTDSSLTTPLTNGYTITKPTKTGYVFNGYYTGTNGSGTQYVNASGNFVNNLYQNSASNITLYAYWTLGCYKVTLNKNTSTSDTTTVATIYEKYNTGWYTNSTCTTAISSFNTYEPDWTNHRFRGYYTTRSGGTKVIGQYTGSKTTTACTSNCTLYARYGTKPVVTSASYNVQTTHAAEFSLDSRFKYTYAWRSRMFDTGCNYKSSQKVIWGWIKVSAQEITNTAHDSAKKTPKDLKSLNSNYTTSYMINYDDYRALYLRTTSKNVYFKFMNSTTYDLGYQPGQEFGNSTYLGPDLVSVIYGLAETMCPIYEDLD